ncbi:MAG TPA: DNA primase [Candidatus Kapabacteria bacterium]|nr:DNA primase [Candidatus Kapabacteria bacterium]
MKYSSDIVNRVIESSDIVDLIGDTVRLKRRGRNYIGLCPFHQEKTPSFIVSPDKNIYKCFGCSKGGNAISFMMDFHSYSFNEAIKELANKYGVQLPQDNSFNTTNTDRKDQLYNSLNDAANYYNKLIYSEIGKSTYSYLSKRDVSDASISKFVLGYAPNTNSELYNYLTANNYKEEILVSNGLVSKNDKQKVYDRFRDRAIFPIKDYIGRVVGFGARYMGDDKSQAKYINSAQNEIYDKSNILYGLFEGKNAIRSKECVILTEGYLDVISLSQNGIENVVSSSGTALTNKQLKLLKRFTNKLYISYDGDEAGQKAAEAAAELALSEGFDVYIVTLPDQEDPDSFVRKYGSEQYNYHLRKASTYLEFKIERIKARQSLNTPHSLSSLLKTLLEVVARVPDEIQHDFYIKEIANRLALSEQQLKEAYSIKNRYQIEYLKQFDKDNNIDYNKSFISNFNKVDTAQSNTDLSSIFPEERLILKIALKGSDELLYIFEHTDFEEDTLISPVARNLFEIIAINSEHHNILNAILLGDYTDDTKDAILSLQIDELVPSDNWYTLLNIEREDIDEVKIIKDSVKKLHIRRVKYQIEQVKDLMKSDKDNINHLERFNELKKKEIDLLSSE